MDHLKEEMDLWAQDVSCALAEVAVEEEERAVEVYRTLDSLALAKTYREYMAAAYDPDGDYKDAAANSYGALMNALFEHGIYDLEVPDGSACPRSYSAWAAKHLPLVFSSLWND